MKHLSIDLETYSSERLSDAIKSPEYVKYAYKAAFEWYCLSKFFGKLLPIEQWRDTMGLYCVYTAGLDATGKALIRYV